jgi:hypothetical protein
MQGPTWESALEGSSDVPEGALSAPLPRSAHVEHAGDARVVLLEGLIDHAPLFPPASLALPEAVEEDARARASASAFVLGRFVCPASRLPELPDMGRGISVVLDAPFEPDTRVEAVEAPPGTDLDSLVALAPEVYVEVPLDGELDARLAEIAAHGFHAKARCSGGAAMLGRFMRECHARQLRYKLTAGLHHPVRTQREHGFLNVLAAAVFADELHLDEGDPGAFEVSPASFRCRDRVATHEQIALGRGERLHSIGSCSFFEPVGELESLGVLPL